MPAARSRRVLLAAWLLLALAGAALLVRWDIAQRRQAFESDARVAHRVLSQVAAQHDAILATLVLLEPAAGAAGADRPERRLPALYPQLVAVLRRDPGQAWPEAALAEAEARSRTDRRAALATVDGAAGHYTLVRAGDPSSFALRIDVRRMVPPGEWPLDPRGPVRAVLRHRAEGIVLQAGADAPPPGLTAGFTFAKPLSASSQPLELALRRATGPGEWPWGGLLAWAALAAVAGIAAGAWQRARAERRRSAELLRLSKVARLNSLGEMAAGMAHELNQPLTAVLASAQAARRVLEPDGCDDGPDVSTAREALAMTVAQAQRAADVLARLRRTVQQPHAEQPRQPLQLDELARHVLTLLSPELHRRGIDSQVRGRAPAVWADPVALEQIVHNLVDNAMHALEQRPDGPRVLTLELGGDARHGRLAVRDNGPGIAPELLPRLFEPFFTTRHGGLGLGLTLCETLAMAMGGTLAARNVAPHGAEFALALPAAAQDLAR